MCSPSSKKLCGCNVCLERSFAVDPRASCWSSKNDVRACTVLRSSNKKYLFDCKECGHELEMMVKNVSMGQWCKYCNRDGLCDSNTCEFCYKKSFASHPMALSWSDKNEKSAREMLRGSDKKCWFQCVDCAHEFDVKLFSIKNNKHCSYCTNQKLCEDDCKFCFEKSCASHEMAKAWSALNEVEPRKVFLQSNKKVMFNCLACDHSYETTPNHYYNRGGSCPYCGNIYLCNQECKTCFEKSFASHPKIVCWSSKNTIDPRQIFKGSEKRATFDCDICHSEFDSMLYNVLAGYWCPYCKNKTEAKMLEFLKDYGCKKQVRFDWCRFSQTNNIMPFDFGVGKILIELDGEQHFQQVSNWNSPESVQVKDVEKIQKCVKEGYSIIHINQLDVWNDTYDWRGVIQKEMEELKNETSCVFISCEDVYQSHIVALTGDIKYKKMIIEKKLDVLEKAKKSQKELKNAK